MVVLICVVGNDYRRILDGVDFWSERESVEVIYLLFDNKQDKYGFTSQKNVEDLRITLNDRFRAVTVGYDPQSFENVFCNFYGILKKEVETFRRHVLVDVTSTTKEAYGATVTIALMFRNVRIYIVPPNERGWYVPSPIDDDFEEWFSKTRNIGGMSPQEIYLPGQRLKRPTKDATTVLLALLEHQGFSDTVASVIKWCHCDHRDPVVKNRFSRMINRLEEGGFVEKHSTGHGKEVHLTHFGRIFSEAIKRSRY